MSACVLYYNTKLWTQFFLGNTNKKRQLQVAGYFNAEMSLHRVIPFSIQHLYCLIKKPMVSFCTKRISKFYRVTAISSLNQSEIQDMLDLGVIEPSISPYSSPIVLVPKKDGSVRFCIDFRKLNKVTEFDAEPMPNMEEIINRMSGHKYFTKMDLSKGYWQVGLTERSNL